MSRLSLSVFVLAFLLQLALSVHLQTVAETEKSPLWFVPATEYVQVISGTFRPVLAQAFLMKGALELARQVSKKVDYLLALFDVAIRLDTNLLNAAFLGGMVVPYNLDSYAKANAFLLEVQKLLPTEWRIPYWIGFNYHQIEAHEKAADFYQQAAKLPGAPNYLTTNQVMLVYLEQTIENAIKRTEQLLESIHDEDTRDMIRFRIDWLKQMEFLEQANREFQRRLGRWPNHLQELVEHKVIPAIPHDEIGQGFLLEHPGDPKLGYRVRSDLPF